MVLRLPPNQPYRLAFWARLVSALLLSRPAWTEQAAERRRRRCKTPARKLARDHHVAAGELAASAPRRACDSLAPLAYDRGHKGSQAASQ